MMCILWGLSHFWQCKLILPSFSLLGKLNKMENSFWRCFCHYFWWILHFHIASILFIEIEIRCKNCKIYILFFLNHTNVRNLDALYFRNILPEHQPFYHQNPSCSNRQSNENQNLFYCIALCCWNRKNSLI